MEWENNDAVDLLLTTLNHCNEIKTFYEDLFRTFLSSTFKLQAGIEITFEKKVRSAKYH